MDKIFELNRTHGDYMKRKTKSRLLKIDMNLKNFLVHFTNWILPDLVMIPPPPKKKTSETF